MKKAYWNKETLLKGFEQYKSKYGHFPTALEIDSTEYLLYLVVGNNTIDQNQLDSYTQSKKEKLPKNVHLISLQSLNTLLDTIRCYDNPLNKN